MKKIGKRTVVLASGTFDLIHYGHVRYLEEAKRTGGDNSRLVVLVTRDRTVEKLKGRKPILPEDQRRAIVEALKPVDEAMLGLYEMDPGAVIEEVRPDIIALGYDQSSELESQIEQAIKKHGWKIDVIRIGRFGREELNSSSEIRRRIVEVRQKP